MSKFFSKIDRKYFSYFLLAVLLILLLFGFLGDQDTSFVGSLAPEITGVCLELLVVLWIFDKWQESNKKNKLISLERRLREYLIFFLKHNFKTLPQKYRVGKLYGRDHQRNIHQLDSLLKYIRKNRMTEKEVISIQKHCSRESSAIDSLLPVASELTNNHFKAWCRIVYFVNCIAKENEPIINSTIGIIQNIKRFDTASFKEKLYVGAENV